MMICTASWFAKLPPDHVRIGISKSVPRGFPAGYRRLRVLEPGPWFNSVPPAEYLRLYADILAALDPAEIASRLHALAGEERVPVMCCYEAAPKIHAGEQWCHRHLAARFLEDRLGIVVEEVGWEGQPFDRFALLRRHGIAPPVFVNDAKRIGSAVAERFGARTDDATPLDLFALRRDPG